MSQVLRNVGQKMVPRRWRREQDTVASLDIEQQLMELESSLCNDRDQHSLRPESHAIGETCSGRTTASPLNRRDETSTYASHCVVTVRRTEMPPVPPASQQHYTESIAARSAKAEDEEKMVAKSLASRRLSLPERSHVSEIPKVALGIAARRALSAGHMPHSGPELSNAIYSARDLLVKLGVGRQDLMATLASSKPSDPECMICCYAKPTQQLVVCASCGYAHCMQCLVKLMTEDQFVVRGESAGCCLLCRTPLSVDVESFLDTRTLRRREYFRLRRELGSQQHVIMCCTEGCWHTICVPKGKKNASTIPATVQCEECAVHICVECELALPFEGAANAKSHQCAKRKKERVLSIQNKMWIMLHTKRCPSCRTRIQKSDGCSHMTCGICRHEFCWLCRGAYDEDADFVNCRCWMFYLLLTPIVLPLGVAALIIGAPIAGCVVCVGGVASWREDREEMRCARAGGCEESYSMSE